MIMPNESLDDTGTMGIIDQWESEVRSYVRSFPCVFDRAEGSRLWDEDGRCYIDFFSGAGALNYGHNHPLLKAPLLRYLERNGITHSLDMATRAKTEFLESFAEIVLEPRGLDFKVQFPGPTGTNAVESALKLARKITGRDSIVSFTNAFHGMTLGSLSVTGNAFKRRGAGVPLGNSACMPFDGYFGTDIDTVEYFDTLLLDQGSGVDLPAAVIVETIQAEGGVRVASSAWLRALAAACHRHDVLLIVDDVQVGCGRTGPFFSFERAGIQPDLVCLSKSLSGMGLPLAVTLIRPELDQWEPGEHNGTFRGHNPAFVTARAALESFWQDEDLSREVVAKGQHVHRFLTELAGKCGIARESVRGLGLIQGLDLENTGLTREVCRRAFESGLILESSGPESTVLKIMPPLLVDTATLEEGLHRLAASVIGALEAGSAETETHA
ncbi:diaminobutyrate--2-oxoglutarate transaminase [Myxococcota bacterium]|nr:diaminobutyrate--2-oxoglutarate transaminase [Myxococcota bacterium]